MTLPYGRMTFKDQQFVGSSPWHKIQMATEFETEIPNVNWNKSDLEQKSKAMKFRSITQMSV